MPFTNEYILEISETWHKTKQSIDYQLLSHSPIFSCGSNSINTTVFVSVCPRFCPGFCNPATHVQETYLFRQRDCEILNVAQIHPKNEGGVVDLETCANFFAHTFCVQTQEPPLTETKLL